MKLRNFSKLLLWAGILVAVLFTTANAELFVQCPGDTDGDLVPDPGAPGYKPNVVCMHITGGDGFVKMADGADTYIFSFGKVDPTVTPLAQTVSQQALKAMLPAPTIELEQGQELYLTMTNVGMVMRPDLFDTHSVHWHGFPNAAPIFDGLPEPSPTAIMGASFTYYYNAAVPGTFFYHCHVEAAEHMQMGMIGNLWVKPSQDGTPITDPDGSERSHSSFVYNDIDGATGYDVDYPIQLTGFDPDFHEASVSIQILPFAAMHDTYTLINGRGYPDTVNQADLANMNGFAAQRVNSLVEADSGDKVLLRVSNVSTTHQYAFTTTLGVPMKVVGRGAEILRGPDGKDTSWETMTLNVGGGQAYDVIVDTLGVPAGTYFLYATTLENLSNGTEERGGLMTEIIIN